MSKVTHIAVQGMTESGKSFLCQKFSQYAKKRGSSVIVYDPVPETWADWGNVDFVTNDPEKFVWVATRARRVFGFIDECHQLPFKTVGRSPANELVTRGRHNGNKFILLGQRATQMPTIVRDNVSGLFLFKTTDDGAEIWRKNFCQDELKQAVNLDQYEFIFCRKYGQPKRLRLRA